MTSRARFERDDVQFTLTDEDSDVIVLRVRARNDICHQGETVRTYQTWTEATEEMGLLIAICEAGAPALIALDTVLDMDALTPEDEVTPKHFVETNRFGYNNYHLRLYQHEKFKDIGYLTFQNPDRNTFDTAEKNLRPRPFPMTSYEGAEKTFKTVSSLVMIKQIRKIEGILLAAWKISNGINSVHVQLKTRIEDDIEISEALSRDPTFGTFG